MLRKSDWVRLMLTIPLIIAMWCDVKWVLYIIVTMLIISNELISFIFRDILKLLRMTKP